MGRKAETWASRASHASALLVNPRPVALSKVQS